MPPFDISMDNRYYLESSTTNVFSTVPPTSSSSSTSKDEQTIIPQLSFDGLLRRDADLPSSKLPFVWKLYEMLEGVEKSGDESIVSWVEFGRAFRVHQLDEFVKKIVPIYFKQSKYKSFQRQLNFYGFTRISTGQNEGAYYHSQFLKEHKTLCLSIRPKVTKAKKKQAEKKRAEANVSASTNRHWMSQIGNPLSIGADPVIHHHHHHNQQQPRQQQQQCSLQPPPHLTMHHHHHHHQHQEQHLPRQFSQSANNEEDEPRDGDAVTIFDNMSFHFVSKRR